jgi:GNAT superfamily N-acetyltransferase
MEIGPIRESEVEAARRLLAGSGWAHRVGDAEAFRRLVSSSQRVAVAVEGGEVVGFARALCDGLSNGYLSMVVVAQAHRRKGIGRRLVEFVVGDDPGITWVLRAGRPEEAPFFRKLGFAESSVAMERLRAR